MEPIIIIRFRLILVITWLAVCLPGTVAADEILVATASNFGPAMKPLTAAFEQATGHKIKVSLGSTGKHYAQILNGAPFDLFLSADSLRPELLENAGLAIPGSRFSYAIGQLILWSSDDARIDAHGTVLKDGDFDRLAIANPKLAPYGVAALQVLEALGQFRSKDKRLVMGENINQAFQFVATGNADIGLIARAQLTGTRSGTGSQWPVPEKLYEPIVQQAVQLTDEVAATEFSDWLQTDVARDLIRTAGYEVP